MKKQDMKIWDLGIRLFHLALILLVTISFYSGHQDKLFTDYGAMHLYAGITILMLMITRIIWGFMGSDNARFKNFIKSPKNIVANLKGEDSFHWKGHNPAGGLMVLIFIMALLTQAILGLFSSDDMDFYGPLNSVVSSEFSAWAMSMHKLLAKGILVLIVVHFIAVIFTSSLTGVPIIRAMITGKGKREGEAPRLTNSLWFFVLFLAVAAVVCISLFT